MAENKNAGRKPGRPRKNPEAEASEEKDVSFNVPEEIATENTAEKAQIGEENVLTVMADDVKGVGYDGEQTPLTELEPELKGQEVEVPMESVVEEKEEAPKEETFKKSDVQKMIADAVARAMASVPAQQTPQVIQVSNDTEMVHFLWMAPVADDNIVFFGEGGIYGQIVGKTGSFYVPKRDLSRVLTEVNRVFMARRWLIVVSGLNEDEREALGVNYREGEILDRKVFTRIVEFGEEMLEIYPKLCDGHKKMVAQGYMEAYENGDTHVTREIVVQLNEMSKTAEKPRGDFVHIIERMNEREAL